MSPHIYRMLVNARLAELRRRTTRHHYLRLIRRAWVRHLARGGSRPHLKEENSDGPCN